MPSLPYLQGDRTQPAAMITDCLFAVLISIEELGLPFISHLPLNPDLYAQDFLEQQPFTLS